MDDVANIKASTGAAPNQDRLASHDALPGTINLNTLIGFRWVAIVGQLAAVLTVYVGFGHPLPLAPALAVIGASVLLNLAATWQGRTTTRLGQRDAALYLAYDILQLTALLYLTGGLSNPFALLLLAPLTAAATILPRRYVLRLGALALAAMAGLALWHLPLPAPEAPGQPDTDPGIVPGQTVTFLYKVSVWVALTVAALFISGVVWRISAEARRLTQAYAASQAALAREQRLAALGGLAAAAAHELGTPLATIAVVAHELEREIGEASPHAEDVRLLASEAQRCRNILADLSRRPEADGGAPYTETRWDALVAMVAEPHVGDAHLTVEHDGPGHPPAARRTPERIHGLGNLLGNALQFARRRVVATIAWTPRAVTLTIDDDGPGFPAGLLARLGEPFLSSRRGQDGHMGLGVFIARSLLERDGASVAFGRAPGLGGARVTVTWPRHDDEPVV